VVKKSRRTRAPRSETEAVWRQVFDALPTPIAVLDADGVVVAENRAFRRRVPATVAADGDRSGQEPDDEAARFALVAVDAIGFCTLEPSGLVFDCCRLDSAPGLIALVGQTR
jgi:PAS domain-containing protein